VFLFHFHGWFYGLKKSLEKREKASQLCLGVARVRYQVARPLGGPSAFLQHSWTVNCCHCPAALRPLFQRAGDAEMTSEVSLVLGLLSLWHRNYWEDSALLPFCSPSSWYQPMKGFLNVCVQTQAVGSCYLCSSRSKVAQCLTCGGQSIIFLNKNR
jgi:hypothetical protein